MFTYFRRVACRFLREIQRCINSRFFDSVNVLSTGASRPILFRVAVFPSQLLNFHSPSSAFLEASAEDFIYNSVSPSVIRSTPASLATSPLPRLVCFPDAPTFERPLIEVCITILNFGIVY